LKIHQDPPHGGFPSKATLGAPPYNENHHTEHTANATGKFTVYRKSQTQSDPYYRQ